MVRSHPPLLDFFGERMAAEVEIANGGYVVSEVDHRGQTFFCGRDGYWTRIKQAAAPFMLKAVALARAEELNNERSRK